MKRPEERHERLVKLIRTFMGLPPSKGGYRERKKVKAKIRAFLEEDDERAKALEVLREMRAAHS